MKYINDAVIDRKISKIGLGTGRFGTKVPESLAFEMLDLFLKYGGTVIDTARNYYEWVENGRGKSEACIGKWMEAGNTRKKVCLVTKGGVKNYGKVWDINLSRENLVHELKESMEALRTDSIDIYLLHRDEAYRPVEEIMESMQYLTEIGNISSIGAANWNIRRIKKANHYAKKHGLKSFRLIQTWWSAAEYTKEMWNDENTTHMDQETHQYILDNHLIGMAYTSQCKGYFHKAAKFGAENVDPFLRKRIETKRNLQILNYIVKYCEKHNLSITDAVNSYITSNRAEGIALVSCSSIEQVMDVVTHCDSCMPEDVIEHIKNIKGED